MTVAQIVKSMEKTHCGDWPTRLIEKALQLEEQLSNARAENQRIDRIMRESLAELDELPNAAGQTPGEAAPSNGVAVQQSAAEATDVCDLWKPKN